MADLSWVLGRRIATVTFHEPELWRFGFDGGGVITAECPWRVLSAGRIVVSSDDHQQRFGLQVAIDAGARATQLLSDKKVNGAEVKAGTLDLLLDCEGDIRLELVPISSGYESWQITDPLGQMTIAMGGGNLVTPDEV